jgi:hypothetical protein
VIEKLGNLFITDARTVALFGQLTRRGKRLKSVIDELDTSREGLDPNHWRI